MIRRKHVDTFRARSVALGAFSGSLAWAAECVHIAGVVYPFQSPHRCTFHDEFIPEICPYKRTLRYVTKRANQLTLV